MELFPKIMSKGAHGFGLMLKWARVARLTVEMLAATIGNAVNAVSSKGDGVHTSLGVYANLTLLRIRLGVMEHPKR